MTQQEKKELLYRLTDKINSTDNPEIKDWLDAYFWETLAAPATEIMTIEAVLDRYSASFTPEQIESLKTWSKQNQ